MLQASKSRRPAIVFPAIALCGAALIGGMLAARGRARHDGEPLEDRIKREAAILGLSTRNEGDDVVRAPPNYPIPIRRLPEAGSHEAPLAAPAKPGAPADANAVARDEAARTLEDVYSRTTLLSRSGPLPSSAATGLRSIAGTLRNELATRTTDQATISGPTCYRAGCVLTLSTRDQAAFEATRASLLALVDYDPRHRFGQGLTYVSSPLPMPDGALETTVIIYDQPDPRLAQLLDRSAAPAPADSKP
jgi:hypothetical protein